MPRTELSPVELAELDALDRILAGEAVDDGELELAALVASVRADAPVLDAPAVARIDARVKAGRTRSEQRRARLPRARWGWIGPSLAGLVAAAVGVAFAIGALNGSSATTDTVTPASVPARSTNAAASAPSTVAAEPSAGAFSTVTPTSPLNNGRLEQRAATLLLATSAGRFGAVANEIIVASEQLGGIVSSSNINQQGSASLATFQLSVPSGSVSDVIATITRLAQVQSLSQSSQDITNSYNGATGRLAASRSQRAALLAALAHATTVTEATSLHHRIDALDGTIAAQERTVARLHGEATKANLQVTLDIAPPTPAARHAAGTLARGWHDARDVLEVSLAVALVALAVIVPIGLVALVLWSGVRLTVRRGRERALERA